MRRTLCAFASLAILVTAHRADAQGHRAPAAGARGAGMAGVGVGLAGSPLEALRLNPALLTQAEGTAVELTLISKSEDGSVTSRVGPFEGSTADDNDEELLPAFAWSHRVRGSRLAYGIGLSNAGSFGVDYPQDSTNPLLAPQPFGLGHTYSRYEVWHAPFAAAYEVNPALSLGFAARLGQASLAANPARFASPDCSAGGVCFLPAVDGDRQIAIGFQVGLLYEIGERFALGASYASGEEYDFAWNTAVANPNLPSFGTRRTVELTVGEPAVAAVGVAFKTRRLVVAIDGQQIAYEDADGFGDAFGFADVTAVGVGVEMQLSDALTLRLGATQADSPLDGGGAFLAVGSPVVVEDRYAAGLTWRLGAGELDIAYLRGDEGEVSGPFVSPVIGPVPGTSVTLTRSVDMISVGFRYHPGQ